MAGLFRKDPASREGKYPVLLRRDGTVPEWEWFVLGARDPAAITAIRAYADEAKSRGWDPAYVKDLYELAESWMGSQSAERLERLDRAQATRYADDPRNASMFDLPKPADPDGPRHRTDDRNALTFPATLAEFVARVKREALEEALHLLNDVADDDMADDGQLAMAGKIERAIRARYEEYEVRPGKPRTGRSA